MRSGRRPCAGGFLEFLRDSLDHKLQPTQPTKAGVCSGPNWDVTLSCEKKDTSAHICSGNLGNCCSLHDSTRMHDVFLGSDRMVSLAGSFIILSAADLARGARASAAPDALQKHPLAPVPCPVWSLFGFSFCLSFSSAGSSSEVRRTTTATGRCGHKSVTLETK